MKSRFQEVLNHDFEYIFSKSILDDFEFPNKYLPTLKRNVKELQELNFKQLNAEIIGDIYNTLIDNQEQHDRGQHFTNTYEVDIICGFCINKNTHFVIDTGCGAGTFLVRAYKFIKYFNPNMTHRELMERLWGIDIAPFPVFLAMMNLSLMDISCKENYPSLIMKDFVDVNSSTKFKMINLDITHELQIKQLDGKNKQVQIPIFDCCIGNPPYIRQELISKKDNWKKLIKKEFDIKKINQQSDLYVYYLIHTAAFLKSGCRLGYVISSSWLDVNFGASLQNFLLDHFKIIAIIDNQVQRSFDTASINTVILIIEKCSDSTERDNNNVRFVRVFKEYKEFIGKIDEKNRIEKVINFINKIEKVNFDIKEKDISIVIKKQNDLKNESTFFGKYENGYWGAKYLRATDIYNKIISHAKNKMIPLNEICDIRRGFTTGANSFFYLTDDTDLLKNMSDKDTKDLIGQRILDKKKFFSKYGWYYSDLMKRHYLLEKDFLCPLFKTQREANNLDVDKTKLKLVVLICNYPKRKLKNLNYKVLNYINDAEKHDSSPHLRPTCTSRISKESGTDWYMLGEDIPIGDFIFPSKIGEKYRLIDNRNSRVLIDKVNYNISVKRKYKKYSNYLFLYLNSITFRSFLDLFSRQLTGNLTYSDVDVNLVDKTMIIHPSYLEPFNDELKSIYHSLKNREQSTIFNEIKNKDRYSFESIIFKIIDLEKKDIDELYKNATSYVSSRQDKSDSVRTIKNKAKMKYEDALKLMKDRFDDVRKYSDLIEGLETKEYKSYNLNVKFPKEIESSNGNFFEQKIYVNFIQDSNKRFPLVFENINQVKLFEFLVNTIQIKDMRIKIPVQSHDSKIVLEKLKMDYYKNIGLLKNLLKTFRIKISEIIIYKDILFS